MALLVEHEVGEAQHVARQRSAGAAEDRLHPGDDLGQAERLRDVVVAARPQRLDLVLGRVLRRQEQHRALEALRAQPPPDLDSLEVGEHPVEDDQVRLAPRDRGERVAAVQGLLDVVPLVAERGRDGVDDRRLVVDDEDPLLRFGVPGRVHEPIVPAFPVSRL